MYDLHINASTVDLNLCHWQWINQCYFWFLSMWLSVACPSKQKMRCYHSAHHPTGSLLQVRGGCCHVALIWPASGEDVECILSAAHTAVPPLSIRTLCSSLRVSCVYGSGWQWRAHRSSWEKKWLNHLSRPCPTISTHSPTLGDEVLPLAPSLLILMVTDGDELILVLLFPLASGSNLCARVVFRSFICFRCKSHSLHVTLCWAVIM